METLLGKMAERFDLPAEAAGAPRVTVTGKHRVMVENHREILSYSGESVEIGAGAERIRVRGDGLLLRAMDARMLLITGTVFGVDLE